MNIPTMKCKCEETFERLPKNLLGLETSTKEELHWYCTGCKEKGIYKIPQGYELCLRCKGNSATGDNKWQVSLCGLCNTGGLISWVDKIIK